MMNLYGTLDSEEIKEAPYLNKKTFTTLIESHVRSTKLSYMDSVVHLCEEHNIEMEDIAKYISPVIKNKLEAEAMNLNYLPRGSQLPL
jgi:hypothetical protein